MFSSQAGMHVMGRRLTLNFQKRTFGCAVASGQRPNGGDPRIGWAAALLCPAAQTTQSTRRPRP
jgi:hypothetical protein